MHSLYVEKYDAILRWHEVGQGDKTVICLPGLSLAAIPCFLPVVCLPVLAGYRFVMVDFLGSGDSDHAAGFHHSLENHAGLVAEVIEHLACGPCAVLGYSMGGSVAIELTLRRPELVSKLILAEANLLPGGGAASRYIAKNSRADFERAVLPEMLQSLRREAIAGDVMRQAVEAAWSRADPRGIYENAAMLVNLADDFAERFFGLALPRHFFFGEASLAQGENADCPAPEHLAQHGIQTAVIAGVGHALLYANPKGFADALHVALAAKF
jgi:pimeloyl-ACP methyl ester carboxylesterase